MIHEAMILEYSARHLALIEWASALKLFKNYCHRARAVLSLRIAPGGGDWLATMAPHRP